MSSYLLFCCIYFDVWCIACYQNNFLYNATRDTKHKQQRGNLFFRGNTRHGPVVELRTVHPVRTLSACDHMEAEMLLLAKNVPQVVGAEPMRDVPRF